MIDLKDYSNEDLKALRKSIDKELFDRNGDTSFSIYRAGDVYIQEKGDDITNIYVVTKVDLEYVYAYSYSVWDNYVHAYQESEYETEYFKSKNLLKLNVTPSEVERWYEELSSKIREIDATTAKETRNLIKVYFKQLMRKLQTTND